MMMAAHCVMAAHCDLIDRNVELSQHIVTLCERQKKHFCERKKEIAVASELPPCGRWRLQHLRMPSVPAFRPQSWRDCSMLKSW